mmetsp:Transcript_97776/g.259778  ORF Transcript_97776/g.259778 Transcript_97776/m.259778 type:complete len:210 (+) Transcript_97776:663-1292(+)
MLTHVPGSSMMRNAAPCPSLSPPNAGVTEWGSPRTSRKALPRNPLWEAFAGKSFRANSHTQLTSWKDKQPSHRCRVSRCRAVSWSAAPRCVAVHALPSLGPAALPSSTTEAVASTTPCGSLPASAQLRASSGWTFWKRSTASDVLHWLHVPTSRRHSPTYVGGAGFALSLAEKCRSRRTLLGTRLRTLPLALAAARATRGSAFSASGKN